VRLSEVLRDAEPGFACGKDKHIPVGIAHLRPFNLGEDLDLRLGQLYRVPATDAPIGKVGLVAGDVLFNNTNSADQVGKVAYVDREMEAGFSNHLTRLRFQSDRMEPAFAAVVLHRLWRRRYFERRCTRWVSQAAFNTKALQELEIPLPPVPEQCRIVDILNRANGICRLRREALDKARQVIPALFVDMFGDPAMKRFPNSQLGIHGKVQGGLQVTSKRARNPIELPYLRVANVYRDRLDLSEVKTIRVTEAELARTRLEDGDLLFVEGHGNPDEIGRCAVWDGSIGRCVHQNHLIRVRLNESILHPTFVSRFFNSSQGVTQLRAAGKTTSGLNTISTSNVKSVMVPVPPRQLQSEFANRAAEIQATIAQQEVMAEASNRLATALMDRLFDGVT
jgi:type I restriction enzyme S subunit